MAQNCGPTEQSDAQKGILQTDNWLCYICRCLSFYLQSNHASYCILVDTHTHHLLHMFPHFYTGHLWCISILFRSMKRLFTTFLVYLDELINRFYLNNQVHHILAYKYIGHFDRYHGLSSGYFQCSEML